MDQFRWGGSGATGIFHHVVQNCVLAVFFNEQRNRHLGAMATGAVKQNMVVGYRLQFTHANECRASGRARSSHCFHSRLTDQIRLIQYHCYASGYPPCASGSAFIINNIAFRALCYRLGVPTSQNGKACSRFFLK